MSIDIDQNNQILRTSFYSANEGYVAFNYNVVGYTIDSGKTFLKKTITLSTPINYNGFNPGLPFNMTGLKAFNKDSVIVYGDFAFTPAIMISTDQCNSYKIVFLSNTSGSYLNGSIKDVVFPSNGNIGYACDFERVLKTNNKGQTWAVSSLNINFGFNKINALDDNNAFVFSNSSSTANQQARMIKTTNGSSWSNVTLPAPFMYSADFLSSQKGWISTSTTDNKIIIYRTLNGGTIWTPMHDGVNLGWGGYNMKFINDSTGFVLAGTIYQVSKTVDSGKIWEVIPRTNNFSFASYGHNDMQFINNNQFWAAGRYGLLEVNTNVNGPTLPKANFGIDTNGVASTNIVNLKNYSKPNYQYKWFVNGIQISTNYNSSYSHNSTLLQDTIKLVVINSLGSDTLVKYQDFPSPINFTLLSFTPIMSTDGGVIDIIGTNFNNISQVKLGPSNAISFSVVSPTLIKAYVAFLGLSNNITGPIIVTNYTGSKSLPGFTHLAPFQFNFSDTILCKNETIIVTINNTEPNVRYTLIDNNTNSNYGTQVATIGASTISFPSTQIPISGNYRIKAERLNQSSYTLSNTKYITVEKTKSILYGTKVNIEIGEKVNFKAQSNDANQYIWNFYQDANISTSNLRQVDNVQYSSTGQKTLRLISISSNGCKDTLNSNAVFVYTKPLIEDVCYANNISDSLIGNNSNSSFTSNEIVLSKDNGYYISGSHNNPLLKSRYGVSKSIFKTSNNSYVSYFAKYTTNGVLKWNIHFKNFGTIINSKEDINGNVYIVGYSDIWSFLTLVNGDSIRVSALSSDTINYAPYAGRTNGFILKLDSLGNYIWHKTLNDPTPINLGYPYTGVYPNKIDIKNGTIVLSGAFFAKFQYCSNNICQTLYDFQNSTSNMQDYNFILKLNLNGELIWNTYFKNEFVNGKLGIRKVLIDNSNNIVVIGNYENKVIINDVNNVNSVTYIGQSGDKSSYVLKFNDLGQLLWKSNITNSFYFREVVCRDLDIDNNNNIYLSGQSSLSDTSQFVNIINADNSISKSNLGGFFLYKYNSQGIFKWSVGSQFTKYCITNSVYVKENEIIFSGKLSNDGSDSFNFTLTSTDNNNFGIINNPKDFFIAKYDTLGILKKYTKSGFNINGVYNAYKVILDNNNNFLISGSLSSTVCCGEANQYVYNCLIIAPGNFGLNNFFAKLNLDFCYPTAPPVVSAGLDKTICNSQSTVIGGTANPTFGYYWKTNNSNFTSTLPNPIVSPSIATFYYLTVINQYGMVSRDTVIVNVNPLAIDAGVDRIICTSNSTQLGIPAATGHSYSWTSSPAGFTSNSAIVNVSPNVTTSYFLVVTNSTNGCIGYDTVKVTVASTVIPSVSIATSQTAICSGTSVTLTATPINGGVSPTYQWQVNGINVGTNSNIFTTNTLTNGAIVRVIMNSSLPCPSSSSVTSNSITFTVTQSYTPSVTVTTPNATVCNGTNVFVTFTATPVNGGANPSYQWFVGNNWEGSNSNTFTYDVSNLIGTINVYVKMTSSLPCTNAIFSTPINVTVLSSATPSVNISTTQTTVCSGQSVTFTATPTNGGTSPSYQWQVNGVNAGTNSNIFTSNTITNNAVVKVMMTSSSNCVTTPTVTSNSIAMTVNNLVTPSVSINSNATTICPGQSVTFTAIPTNGGTSPSYQWQENGVNVGTNSNTYTSSTLANGATVKVIMTSSLSCVSPLTVTSNTVTTVVTNAITPSVNISASQTTICSSQSVTFTATPTNGGTSPSFQWQVNGVNVGTNSNTYSSSTLANGAIVKVIMTSSLGCASPLTATSNTVTIVVTSTVTPSVNISASQTTICSGQSVTFTATPTNSGTSPSYQWQVNGVYVGTNSNTYTSSTLANGTIVKVIMTSSLGCASPLTATSNSIIMAVTNSVAPSVSINSSTTTICTGASVTFTATPTNGGTAPTYQWQVNGANVGTNSNTFATNTLTNSAVVKCIMTSNSNCATTPTATSNSITMLVNNSITPTLTASGTTTVITGSSSNINTTNTNGGTTPTYQWQDSTLTTNWTNIAGATNSSINYTPTATGVKLRCRLTSNASCASPNVVNSNTLTFTVTTATAINPVAATSYGIKYFPNPVENILTLDSLKLLDKWQTVEIKEISGKQISIQTIANKTTVQLNVTSLAKGIYVAILRKKDGLKTYLKFIKN